MTEESVAEEREIRDLFGRIGFDVETEEADGAVWAALRFRGG